MSVFVISNNNKPLMPCSSGKAYRLLKNNRAVIVDYKNFTIKLLYPSANYTQKTIMAVDTGAKYLGLILRNGRQILLARQVKLRTDISSLLSSRKILRRARRNKLRYRQPRFLNRTKPVGWLPPSIESRANNTIRFIRMLESKLPDTTIIIEVGNFDVQKMKNPNIKCKEYQQGSMLGFNEYKKFVLTRDNYQCKHKECNKISKKLHVHHVIYKSNGGSDRPDNLITLCEDCHNKLHKGIIDDNFKRVTQYKEPPFMNNLKVRLFNEFNNTDFCYGYETKTKRYEIGLPKTHINDAIAISFHNQELSNLNYPELYEYVIQVRSKKRSLHEQKARKGRKTPNIAQKRNSKNTPELKGFKLGMQVSLGNEIGYVTGFSGTSTAYIKDKNDKYIQDNPKHKQVSLSKLNKIKYNNNWVRFTSGNSSPS